MTASTSEGVRSSDSLMNFQITSSYRLEERAGAGEGGSDVEGARRVWWLAPRERTRSAQVRKVAEADWEEVSQ